ncbi:MAG: hypothetical protein IJ519_06195 [Clostridia bacterium]|nr:hypothetical protein [Clostridia bacterium]
MDKKYLKTVLMSIATLLVCAGVVCYLGYHFFTRTKQDVTVMPAETVTVEEKSEYTAYLMRSERVIYVPTDGGVSYTYENGERVSNGSMVARLYSGENGAQVRSELVEYDEKISVLTQSNVDVDTRFIGTAVIDAEINSTYELMMRKLAEGDIDYALQKKRELAVLLNRRKVLVGSVEGYSAYIDEYQRLEDELIAGLGSSYTPVECEDAGYFYSTIDGYESVFDPSGVSTMTVDDFDAMIASDPVTVTDEGYPIGKMVTEFKWYAVFEIEYEDMKKYTVNYTYDITFPYNSDEKIPMTLERMVTTPEGSRCVVIMSSTETPKNFDYLRAQTVQIVDKSYTGYKVPSSAVRVIDGVQGVYVLDGSVARFRRIHPLTESDGYIIVRKQDTLDEESAAYDLGYCELIITGGKDIYEGKIIE